MIPLNKRDVEAAKFISVSLFMMCLCFNIASAAAKGPEKVFIKEKFRVRDDVGDFFFKYPASPVVDDQGFIFVDDKDQVLMFSPQGNFLGNFFTKGQGPGELTSVCAVIPGENILIINRNPWKLVWFSRKGKFLKEKRLSDKLGFSSFFTYYNGRYYFFVEKFRHTKNKAVYLDIDVELLSIAPNEKNPRYENINFPKRYFVMNTNWIMNVHFVQVGLTSPGRALIANNGNYEIKQLDLDKMTMIPFIKKGYKKVTIKSEWKKILKPSQFPHYGPSGKEYKVFERKTLDDVQRIWLNGNKTWILTSTFDEEPRLVRTDVYDSSGEYQGVFYLKMPKGIYLFKMSYTSMTLHKEKLYIFETSGAGEIALVCYELLDVAAWAR